MKTLNELFTKSINRILKFKLGLESFEYKNDQLLTNWREYEAELEINYPIKGTQLTLSDEVFRKWKNQYNNNLIINSEKDISSFDITDELADEPFKYKEMTLVYLFTILEDFGNSIIELVNNQYFKNEIQNNGKSWHSKINKYQLEKGNDLTKNFADVFNLKKEDIYPKFVNIFYELKNKRNSIAHELHYPDKANFHKDVEAIIIIMSYIYIINDKPKSELKIYPWYDYD